MKSNASRMDWLSWRKHDVITRAVLNFRASTHNNSFVQALETRGFFSDEDEAGTERPTVERTQLGALKRAALRLARTRLDIIYSLPEDKVAALAAAPLPYPDRKARP